MLTGKKNSKLLRNKKEWSKRLFIIAFTIFPFLFLITFTYYPLVNMLGYSFTDWNGSSKEKTFVGLANYIRVFTDSQYFGVFKVSFYYIIGFALQMIIALFLASILNFKLHGKKLFKGILFFPYLINGVAVAMMFNFFFTPEGTLDTLLKFFGLDFLIQQWLGNPKLINFSLVYAQVWRYIGFTVVIFLGAMQAIDRQVYDAADVDGANGWQVFRFIVLPSIKSILELQIILSVKNALSVFEMPYIMTDGANGSMTFVIQTVKTAFNYSKVGLASAMAIILFMIIIIITFIEKVLLRKE